MRKEENLLHIVIENLLQHWAEYLMLTSSTQKRADECLGFVGSIRPYVACERGVSLRIKTFCNGQACDSRISGHCDTTCKGYLSNLKCYCTPSFSSCFIFTNDTNRFTHLSIYDSKGHKEELLHPHTPLNILYQSSFNTGTFKCIYQMIQRFCMGDRKK